MNIGGVGRPTLKWRSAKLSWPLYWKTGPYMGYAFPWLGPDRWEDFYENPKIDFFSRRGRDLLEAKRC